MSSKVVIIGGSFSAHMALAAIYKSSSEVEVTLVSPNTHSYFNPGSPRLLVEPEKFDDTVFSIEKFVQKHSQGKGKYVHGTATSVDFNGNTVTVETDGGSSVLEYDILVLATGTASKFPGYKVNKSHLAAKSSIEETNRNLKSSKSVAIIGGGATGVETAGEIAHAIEGVKVTLYTGGSAPLASFPKLKDGATPKLRALGVDIVNNVRSKSLDGNTIHFENGQSKTFDVVLDATTQTPYSEYLPDSVKDERGFVVTNKQLVVKGTSNVIAIGDIVSGASRTLVDLKMGQIGVFGVTIKKLLGLASGSKEWNAVTSTILVPISPNGGEGTLFGWHIPSWMVKQIKAKTFFLNKAGEDLA